MKKLLIVSCTSGMCNRIHSIIGGMVLAEKLNRDFFVFWPENAELTASAHFVLANPPKLISSEDLIFRVSRPEITVRVFNSGFGPFLECDSIEDSDHDILLLKPWFIPRLKGEPHNSRTYFPLRKYLPDVAFNPDSVKLASPENYSGHVGIHIRHGDPVVGGGFKQVEYFSESDPDSFNRVMELITRKSPGTRFYVSSTNNQIKSDLAKKYNVDYRPTTPDRSENGIREAIIDITNLCGCNCLIGSYRSQFTRMVGFVTQKTVAIVGKNSHLDFAECIPATLEEISEWAIRRLRGDEIPDPLQSPPNSLHLPLDFA